MLQNLYKNRFPNLAERNNLWKNLVIYFFNRYISKKDIVLDLGCGYGEFINNIQCKTKIAVDLNPNAKNYLNKNIVFKKSTSTKLPLADNSVDKVFISNFFEHIAREEIVNTIKELKRVLKEKGQVLILQPNIRFCAKDYWMFFDHITPIDDRALEEIFISNNFSLIYRVEKFLPYTTKSNLPKTAFFVRLYLALPLFWRLFGKQSFLIFQK